MGSVEGKTQLVRLLLDTNIIVDVALERQPYFETSQQVLLLVEQGQLEGYISASTFGDLYYIIRRSRGREWTTEFLNWLGCFAIANPDPMQHPITIKPVILSNRFPLGVSTIAYKHS